MIGSQYLYFLGHNLESRLLGRRRPLLASVKLTYDCNLRCCGCPFWKMDGPSMLFDTACHTLDTLYASGVRLVIFEGGEPFLWYDGRHRLKDVVQYARKRFFSVGVTTNGTMPIDVPADNVWVSVDGLADTHNRNRGPVFDRVMSNLSAAVDTNVLANVTVNSLNCHEIPDLVRYLDGRVSGITVQFYYPYEHTEDLSVSTEERVTVLDQLIELKRDGYPIVDSVPALRHLKCNTWRCHPWLVTNAEPDGSINQGCYLEHRTKASCDLCGFAAHVEISLAYDWNLAAIAAGSRIFGFR